MTVGADKRKRAFRIGITVVAFVFLALGVATDGFSDVRAKAIMICMECIGIG